MIYMILLWLPIIHLDNIFVHFMWGYVPKQQKCTLSNLIPLALPLLEVLPMPLPINNTICMYPKPQERCNISQLRIEHTRSMVLYNIQSPQPQHAITMEPVCFACWLSLARKKEERETKIHPPPARQPLLPRNFFNAREASVEGEFCQRTLVETLAVPPWAPPLQFDGTTDMQKYQQMLYVARYQSKNNPTQIPFKMQYIP